MDILRKEPNHEGMVLNRHMNDIKRKVNFGKINFRVFSIHFSAIFNRPVNVQIETKLPVFLHLQRSKIGLYELIEKNQWGIKWGKEIKQTVNVGEVC